VLVVGEQGIGKSALLRAGLAGAGAVGCQVLWGAGDELDQPLPLRLMTRCLAGGGRSAGGGAGGPGLSDRGLAGPLSGDPVLAGVEPLLAAVYRLCAASPVVLVAEDLQWADEASLVAWERLSQAVGQLPLLLAGSFRPSPVREEVERLRRGAAGVVLELGPLPAGEVAELAGGCWGHRRGERLGALPGEAPGVLRWAAVLGQEFTLTGLALVTGQPARALAGAGEPAERVAAELVAAPDAAEEWVWRWLAGLIPGLVYQAPRVAARLLRRAVDQMPVRDARREALEAGLVTAAFLLLERDEVERVARPLLAVRVRRPCWWSRRWPGPAPARCGPPGSAPGRPSTISSSASSTRQNGEI
jgi:AAA ATPase domain